MAYPSEVVYLFGDNFTGSGGLILIGEKLPCSGLKVGKRELAEEMLRAAFAWLVREGYLNLSIGQRKTLIFKSTAVLATLRREGGKVDGLESELLTALANDPSKNGVEEIVARAIGEDSVDPWGAVIDMSREHLLTRGYFKEERQRGLGGLIGGRSLEPDCAKIAPLKAQVQSVQALLRFPDPALDKQLRIDITKGVKSRYETQGVDAE